MADSVISLSILNGNNGFRLDGMENERSGFTVSGAGDVNGDGFDDVIVGARLADHGVLNGSSYVIFGKASGFDAQIDLSSLDGSNGFRLIDGTENDYGGRQFSDAGDVNGDGFDDVIISEFTDRSGAALNPSYVVFGKASGFDAQFDLSDLDGSNGFRLNGFLSRYAALVSNAGDVNGDGFDDVIVRAFGTDSNGEQFGSSYVVFGKASGFGAQMDLSSLDGTNGFRLEDASAASDFLGAAISSAGDVNGDGLDDVIVSPALADTNGEQSGSSYVVFGKTSGFDATLDLSSLDGSNGFRLDGAAGEYSGALVSNAGDVNGDGFDDVIVSAPGSGSSYVVFGKASGFSASMNLSNLDGSNGFRLDNPLDGLNNKGHSISNAGDVNGDGYDDVLVGTPSYDPYPAGNINNGSAYVIFGHASGFSAAIDLSNLDSNSGVRLDRAGVYDSVGSSVSSAGDINGDGFDDLIIGASVSSPHSYSYNKYIGAGYVIFGGSHFTGTKTYTGSTQDDTLTGTAELEYFKANSGNDIMIGGGGADVFNGGAGNDTARVPDAEFHLVNGGSGEDTLALIGGSITLNLTEFHHMINDVETIDLTGTGDNTLTLTARVVQDLSRSTNTLVVKGNVGDRVTGLSQGWVDEGIQGDFHAFAKHNAVLLVDAAVTTDPLTKSVINLSSLDGSNGFRLDGVAEFDRLGSSVSGAGDINGDGFDDLLIGAPGADSNGEVSGSSYVVFGHDSRFNAAIDLSSLDGSNGFRLDGAAGFDWSGTSVSSAGDVNGDGFDDVLVGARYADPNGVESGASYVVFGKANGFAATLDLTGLDGRNGFRLDGISKYDNSGFSVSSAGDVNGDGFDDVIVGARFANANGIYGAGYIVFGKATAFEASMRLSSLDGTNGFSLIGDGYGLGWSVSAAGDVNGDGFDDVILGEPDVSAGEDNFTLGSMYVVFGKASGFEAQLELSRLNGSDGFRIDETVNGHLGYSVSDAGDVNGDGFADIVIGAPHADPYSEHSGSSYVVFGKASGFDAALDLSNLDGDSGFRLVGNYDQERSGSSVSGAGDVNGDGFDDLIIGTSTSNYSDSYVIFGKASGWDATLNLSNIDGVNGVRLTGVRNDSLGSSLSGAGDVNGDGFDDLVVGAPNTYQNYIPHGASYVIFGSRDFGQGGSGGGDLPEIKGTEGDDTLKGSEAAEHFIAGDGNDNLLGRGGADIFEAGAGDDAIRIGDLTFASIDGGEGNDALHLAGSGMNLDLSVLGDQIHNIETICLYGRGDNTLTLTADSLLNLSDSTDTLKVHGNTGDHIVVQDDGWVDSGGHGFYHTYTHDDAVLLVGTNVVVELV